MLEQLLWLVFPRACVGCDRDDVLLCARCAQSAGPSQTATISGLVVHSCFPYAGVMRSAINDFKRGRRAFAADLAGLLVPALAPGTTLVPVPTTRRRRAERGFDQTLLLARMLERRGSVQVADLLTRHGNDAQQGRSRAERIAATGRFGVRAGTRASGATLVLFDDVRTTGATLADAAQTLQQAGCTVASALTLAWAPKEKR